MKYTTHIKLLAANICWALCYPLYLIILPHDIKPIALLTLTLVGAAVISWIPQIGRPLEKFENDDRWLLIAAILLIGVARKLFLIFGVSTTSPIDASIIATMLPLLVLVIAVITGSEKFTTRRATGLALGFAGAVAVLFSASMGHKSSSITGNTLVLIGSLSSAIYLVCCRRLVERYKTTTLLMWYYTIGALLVIPFGLDSLLNTEWHTMKWHTLAMIAFCAIVPTYVPNYLLNTALREVGSTISSIYAYLQPILVVIISVVAGLEHPHLDTLLFASVIFLGVALVISSYKTKPSQQ